MQEPKILDETFLHQMHRHFINIMCTDSGAKAKEKYEGKSAIYNFSAFVVEIRNRWFAISAGHIFRELQAAVLGGAILSDWQIDDSIVSKNPQAANRFPMDIDRDVLWLNNEDDGYDYACIELSYLIQEALRKEGISPIPPSLWTANDLEEFSMWLLVGTPNTFSRLTAGEPIEKCHATILLERCSELPSGLLDTTYKRLHAKIHFESVVDGEGGFDIGGMSGGPIFGLRPNSYELPCDYRIIGIQSAWNKNGSVAICAAYPFILAISRLIDEFVEQSHSKNFEM